MVVFKLRINKTLICQISNNSELLSEITLQIYKINDYEQKNKENFYNNDAPGLN